MNLEKNIIELIKKNNSNNQLLDKDVKIYVEKILSNAIIINHYENKLLAGFCAFYANDYQNKKSFLTMIIVSDKFRGKGIGKMLFEYWMTYTKLQGFKELNLEVKKDNEPAINLYKKYNFKITKEQNDSFIMIRKLINS